jgi:hypothetical protein
MVAGEEDMWKEFKSSFLRRPTFGRPRVDLRSALKSLHSVLQSAQRGNPTPLAVYLRKLFALKDEALYDLTPLGCAGLFNDNLGQTHQ